MKLMLELPLLNTVYCISWLTWLCSGGESLPVTRAGGRWAGSGRGWPGPGPPSSSRAWWRCVSCQVLAVLRSARDCDPSERVSSPKYWPGPPSPGQGGPGCSPALQPRPRLRSDTDYSSRPLVSVFWGQFSAFTPGCLPICIMHPLQEMLVNLN